MDLGRYKNSWPLTRHLITLKIWGFAPDLGRYEFFSSGARNSHIYLDPGGMLGNLGFPRVFLVVVGNSPLSEIVQDVVGFRCDLGVPFFILFFKIVGWFGPISMHFWGPFVDVWGVVLGICS